MRKLQSVDTTCRYMYLEHGEHMKCITSEPMTHTLQTPGRCPSPQAGSHLDVGMRDRERQALLLLYRLHLLGHGIFQRV